MRITDFDKNVKFYRPEWQDGIYWYWDNIGGMLRDQNGNIPGRVNLANIQADDYLRLESDSQKILRLEKELDEARKALAKASTFTAETIKADPRLANEFGLLLDMVRQIWEPESKKDK